MHWSGVFIDEPNLNGSAPQRHANVGHGSVSNHGVTVVVIVVVVVVCVSVVDRGGAGIATLPKKKTHATMYMCFWYIPSIYISRCMNMHTLALTHSMHIQTSGHVS